LHRFRFEEVKMRELDRQTNEDRERLRQEEERIRSQSGEPERNFEQEVSDINTDPDAGFDFDLNPTDDHEDRHSDR
jgi:hypothetical protein